MSLPPVWCDHRTAMIFFSATDEWDRLADEPTECVGGAERNAVDKAIARLNIEFFRKRLGEEADEAKRATILRLLADEEAKLMAAPSPDRKYGG